ncbi:MAG TPA: tRNA pseudouridine(38-40) synthase TruA [Vicinamibacterales bacterium]
MPRALFTLQYLGTRYAGWQTQANAVGVQQIVESALTRLCGEPVSIEGAGRTDSGVHAAGQRAHADISLRISERGILLGVNDLLPHDIRVTEVRFVRDDFHARFEAKKKTYAYRIWTGRVADVFAWPTHAWVAAEFDLGAMRSAAAALVGQHDFRAFTVASPEVSSTVRTVEAAGLEQNGESIEFTITADGFLRFMVRRIAGSLIEIGRGKLAPDAIAASLEPAFTVARWTAPSRGLTMLRVEYGDEAT